MEKHYLVEKKDRRTRVYYVDDKGNKWRLKRPNWLDSSVPFGFDILGKGTYAVAHVIIKHALGKQTADFCAHRFKRRILKQKGDNQNMKISVSAVVVWEKRFSAQAS